MDEQLKSNLTSGKHWSRFLYMVLFAVCMQVASFVMWVLVGLQFLFALITGADNNNLRTFGSALSEYIYQALQFLTYNTDEKPFPFAPWPSVDSEEEALEGEVEFADRQEDTGEDLQEDTVVVNDDEPQVDVVDEEPVAEAETTDSARVSATEDAPETEVEKP